MSRFVVLHHQTLPEDERPTHWDFMLGAGDVLRAWALETEPLGDSQIAAAELADHRPLYLDYEGEISGGRGRVARWDGGEYELLEESADLLSLRVRGNRLQGRIDIRRTEGASWVWRYWVE